MKEGGGERKKGLVSPGRKSIVGGKIFSRGGKKDYEKELVGKQRKEKMAREEKRRFSGGGDQN